MVDDQSFFENAAELVVKLAILFGLILRDPVESIEHAFDERSSYFPDDAIVLQRFSRNVQRQVFGINESPQESQVIRYQLAAVALDEHALGAEAEPMIQPGEAQVFEIG